MKLAKMALFTGLVMASLLGGTVQAQTEELSFNYTEIEWDYPSTDQEPVDQLVNPSGEAEEDQESSSQSTPEWRYVPIRRTS